MICDSEDARIHSFLGNSLLAQNLNKSGIMLCSVSCANAYGQMLSFTRKILIRYHSRRTESMLFHQENLSYYIEALGENVSFKA